MENRKKPTRRDFLKLAGAASGSSILAACAPAQPTANIAPAATAAPATAAPAIAKDVCAEPDRPWLKPTYQMEAGPIARAGWGGSFSDQEHEAVWTPFTKLSGVKVVEVPHTNDILEQLKAQQAAGKVEFDIVETTAAIYQANPDLWMPIDYDIFPKVTLDTMLPIWKQTNVIAYAEVPIVIAWSEKAFLGDDKPDSWAKFWDVKKYPGKRSLVGYSVFKVIEAALLADGVARDKIYPFDVERAFKKLEEIKPHIVKWWTSGTEAQQLLANGDVTVIGMSNSRIENLLDQKLPFSYTLNEALVHSDFIGVVKGAPNAKAAMAGLAFWFEPTTAARIGEFWRQPIPASTAWDCADPEKRKRWTNAPENAEKIFVTDPFYWAEKGPDGRTMEETLQERFAEFVAA